MRGPPARMSSRFTAPFNLKAAQCRGMRTGGPRTQSGTGVAGAARLVAFDLKGKVPTTFAYNPGIQYKLPYDSVIDI